MRLRLLPSFAGSDAQRQTLTSILINDSLAIDGGSIGFALTPDEMTLVRDIIVTHAHSDHTASLPVFIAEAFVKLDRTISIYATSEVVAAIRSFIFNDHIWPNFENIPLISTAGPSLQYCVLQPREKIELLGLTVTPIPVSHLVPTVGLVVADAGATVVITSDTYVTDEIWEVAREVENLRAIFVDVSYPNELEKLAAAALHFTPQSLAADLKKLARDDVEILAVHIKPTNRERVIRQLADLTDPPVKVAEIGRTYEW